MLAKFISFLQNFNRIEISFLLFCILLNFFFTSPAIFLSIWSLNSLVYSRDFAGTYLITSPMQIPLVCMSLAEICWVRDHVLE